MVTPIHIGIAGTHSTGKTTLARRIEMELRASGLTVARTSGLAKRAASLGFPKMARHTAASTEWIITSGAAAALEAELTAEVILVDRTAHDALAYYAAALQHRDEQPSLDDINHLTALATLHTRRQVLLLATVLDPAIPPADHPGKDPSYQDTAFREAVDQRLHQNLQAQEAGYLPVSPLEHATAVRSAVSTVMDRLATA